MNNVPSIEVVELALRTAVPEDVSDSDFLSVDWRGEAEYIVECLKNGETFFTHPDMCRALGHMSAMRVLRNAGLV